MKGELKVGSLKEEDLLTLRNLMKGELKAPSRRSTLGSP